MFHFDVLQQILGTHLSQRHCYFQPDVYHITVTRLTGLYVLPHINLSMLQWQDLHVVKKNNNKNLNWNKDLNSGEKAHARTLTPHATSRPNYPKALQRTRLWRVQQE